MAIQSTPPIQLDPSMDNGHQLAFINQNFQSIANVLQQNSFVIVQSGTTTIPAITVGAPGAGQYGSGSQGVTINHNLGFVPIVMASVLYGSTYVTIPYTTTSNTATTAIWYNFWSSVDSTQVSFVANVLSYNSAASNASLPVKYYLLRQTAN